MLGGAFLQWGGCCARTSAVRGRCLRGGRCATSQPRTPTAAAHCPPPLPPTTAATHHPSRQIPAHKVKLVVGAGGETIKRIQKRSKCRIQVRAAGAMAWLHGCTAGSRCQEPPEAIIMVHAGCLALIYYQHNARSARNRPLLCLHCTLQVKKDEADLNVGWGAGGFAASGLPPKGPQMVDGKEVRSGAGGGGAWDGCAGAPGLVVREAGAQPFFS